MDWVVGSIREKLSLSENTIVTCYNSVLRKRVVLSKTVSEFWV